MSLTPLTSAPLPIQIHAYAALIALPLGAAQLYLAKGNGLHKVTGYIWAALMMLIAMSGFFIHEIRMLGPFSPIHLLSILVLVTVPLAVLKARKGDINGHHQSMTAIFWLALVLAGVVTLMPGRIMGEVIFGP